MKATNLHQLSKELRASLINEFNFNIYDDDDFQFKRKHIGEEIISEKNKVN